MTICLKRRRVFIFLLTIAFLTSCALDCAEFACHSDDSRRVSLDEVVRVMKPSGHDLPSLYRETAEGGLAVNYNFPLGK